MNSDLSKSYNTIENTQQKTIATLTQKNGATSSYFNKRMKLLGVTKDNNKIGLHQTDVETGSDVIVNVPIFLEVPEGIKIRVYTIDRYQIRVGPQININQQNGHGSINGARWKQDFCIIRLEHPIIRPDGSVMKYKLPKGAGTHPFFPPSLIEKFEKKKNVPTLYCVEGYFKAFKAAIEGIDIIGLSSITHMKNKETGKLHPDILKVIEECSVQKIIWLTDGDAIDITHNEIKELKDISIRPKNFFSSVTTFKTLLSDLQNIELWFFHIDTEQILQANKQLLRDNVKGIDDVLISLPAKSKDIIRDLRSFNPGHYFQKFNVTYGTSKVYNHFHLRDVNDFYLFHVERRPELKNIEFIFNGTRYQYNETLGECDVKIPGEANMYFRVGDEYYKFIQLPNQYNDTERTFQSRQRSTIKEDHGNNFFKHIPKYEAFCNVPGHFNYQQVILNCFNVYFPLDFTPAEDDCSENDFVNIMDLLRHLFGETKVSYQEPPTNEEKEYTTLTLCLDYLQLLYQQPQQKLPILCLVGIENETGKTTFGDFLRMMLGSNVAIVGNSDLSNDFNAHWVTKSVVVCDETKIDKQHVMEKIKSYSTAQKIYMNAKGRAQVELDCFIKFILITNNEGNFINASTEDLRFWVIKVHELKNKNPDIKKLFKEELPAFLSFLNKRKIATQKRSRMWFHPNLLKTDAFKKVIANSLPSAEKTIRLYMKEMFLDNPDYETIEMPLTDIKKEVYANKYDESYITSILQEKLGIYPYHKWILNNEKNKKYNDFEEAIAVAKNLYPGEDDKTILKRIQRIQCTKRYKYPRRVDDNEIRFVNINPKDPGRPYIFNRCDFVSEDEEIND